MLQRGLLSTFSLGKTTTICVMPCTAIEKLIDAGVLKRRCEVLFFSLWFLANIFECVRKVVHKHIQVEASR